MSNLFQQFVSGSEEAFNVYYKRYYNVIYRSLRRFGCDRQLAKDLAQEVFKDVWDRRAGFTDEVHLRNTLFLKAKTCLLEDQRSKKIARKVQRALGQGLAQTDTDRELTLVKEEVSAELRAALGKLPPQQRIVMNQLLEGKSVGLIAQGLQLAPQTVRNHKTQAIHFLRAELLRRDLFLMALAVILLMFYHHL